MVEVMNIMSSFGMFHACTATLSAPDPAVGHHLPTPPPETPGHSWASLGHLLWGHHSFLLGPGAHKLLFFPFKRPVLVLVALWWVNGDLLQEGLCHTQVCCIQNSCPCSSPLLTHTSSGDTLSSVSLCDPRDDTPPGSSLHGISQAKILEWLAISYSRVLPNPGIEPRSTALKAEFFFF